MVRKVIHLVLITSVLLSSTGLVVNQHFCLDQLQRTSLFAQAKACQPSSSPMKVCATHEAGHQRVDRKSCCRDEHTLCKVEEASWVESFGSSWELLSSLAFGLLWSGPALTPEAAVVFAPDVHYQPPALVCDFTICPQTFRC
jgi:hypothetical protein